MHKHKHLNLPHYQYKPLVGMYEYIHKTEVIMSKSLIYPIEMKRNSRNGVTTDRCETKGKRYLTFRHNSKNES